MTILTVGIDLAKNVFALHGVNEAGKAELVRPAVPRDKLARTLNFMAKVALAGFRAASRPLAVPVQSVWIDGTSKVTGSLHGVVALTIGCAGP